MITLNWMSEGLLKALEPHGFCYVDGVPVSTNDAACQAIIDGWTISQARAEVKGEIDAHAAALRNAATASYSPAEMASWALKVLEAREYRSGRPQNTPMLSMEATARGADVSSIISRVEANATALSTLEAGISGAAGKHKDAIDALSTVAEVYAYNWRVGWPA